jgi:uncharacterized membrane protein
MIHAWWDIYLMSMVYLFAGLTHFLFPGTYLQVIPKYLPWHRPTVYLSGAIEILLGVALLITEVLSLAAVGVILLLIAVLPVHVEQFRRKEARLGFPLWVVILRQPIQLLLIWWAWQYV